jgi:hypothetical protein
MIDLLTRVTGVRLTRPRRMPRTCAWGLKAWAAASSGPALGSGSRPAVAICGGGKRDLGASGETEWIGLLGLACYIYFCIGLCVHGLLLVGSG